MIYQQLDEIHRLSCNGDLVSALLRCVDAIRDQPVDVYRGRLIKEFHDLVKPPTRLTPGEHKALQSAIEELSDQIKKRLRIPETQPEEITGAVNGLFITHTGSSAPVGCLHQLTAYGVHSGTPKARNVSLVNPSRHPQTASAVWTAGLAVTNVLNTLGLTARGKQAFQACDVTVWINQGRGEYDGDSLGLPIAVAILSWLARTPIPLEWAFTGAVSPDGTVEPVGGIPEKLKAACLRRLTRVFIPEANLSEVPETTEGIARTTAHLSGLAREVLPEDALKNAVTALNAGALPATPAVEAFDRARRGGMPVLLTCIGNRDPYGDPKYANIAQGPALTAFRHIQPRAVGLLYTPHLGLEDAARATERELKATAPSLYVQPLLLPINDPTDYDEIFEVMDAKVKSFLPLAAKKLACSVEHLEPYVVLSSGTSQMHAVWLELLRRSPMLGAHAMQVLEPAYLAPGDLAVREVSSRHIGFGLQAGAAQAKGGAP